MKGLATCPGQVGRQKKSLHDCSTGAADPVAAMTCRSEIADLVHSVEKSVFLASRLQSTSVKAPIEDVGRGRMQREGAVRAIGRGLAVLRAINQHSSLDMTSIAKVTSLPYPTACRIVETLIDEGMVEREPGRKFYRPTCLVRTLSHGFGAGDDLAAASRTAIEDVTRSILWPLAVCSRVGSTMMIRAASHRLSPKTLTIYHPGYTFPISGCCAGLTYLAFCLADERRAILTGLEQSGEFCSAYARRALTLKLDDIRRRGFASVERCQNNANPGKTSALAAPVIVDGECRGTLTLTVFASAMSIAEAIEQFSGTLLATTAIITDKLASRSVTGIEQLACSRDQNMI